MLTMIQSLGLGVLEERSKDIEFRETSSSSSSSSGDDEGKESSTERNQEKETKEADLIGSLLRRSKKKPNIEVIDGG